MLHTHFTTWDVPAIIAARGRAIVVWHVHSAISKKPWIVARTMLKFVLFGRRTAGILCPAPDIARDARRRLAPASRVRFMPSALEMSRFPLLDPEARRQARAELGLPEEATVLSHFGWHWHLKGNDIFLDAVASLVDEFPDVIAIDRGGDERMHEYAEEIGIADRLRVIEPVENVQTVHGAADVLLSSSRQEGMAYAVLESLASGTAVVATAIPGHSFLGEHMPAVRLTETTSAAVAEATAETLRRSDPEVAEEARQAHEWIARNLSTDAIGGVVADLYEKAAEQSGITDAPRDHSAKPETGKRHRPGSPLRLRQRPSGFVRADDQGAAGEGRDPGWDAEAVVIGRGADAPWAQELAAGGFPVTQCPDASRTEITRWLRAYMRDRPGPTRAAHPFHPVRRPRRRRLVRPAGHRM